MRALRADGGWRKLIEPDADLACAVGFPIGATLAMPVLAFWALATPFGEFRVGYATLVGAALVLGPVHELTHAAVLMRRGVAPVGVVLSPQRLALSIRCGTVVSRNRWVAVLVAPLMTISLLPLLASAVVGSAEPFLVVLSVGNALVSSGDLLAAGLVLAQIPAGAVVCKDDNGCVWRFDRAVDDVSA